jgi:enoyl-CoA hydratase/carnithine racemase
VPYQQILYDVRERIATITLNRQEQLNAWTDVMADECTRPCMPPVPTMTCNRAHGAGRAFCAGGITGFKSDNPRQL